jgi:predicted nucleic acid-binding Zn ribbon protein
MARDLARELYRAFRNQPRRNKVGEITETRGQVGDPQQIGSVLDELVISRDWRQGLAEGNIFADWEKIVGSEIATHSNPISLVDGRLTIQTTSTAWATQLNLITIDLLKTISGMETLKILLEIGNINTPRLTRRLHLTD